MGNAQRASARNTTRPQTASDRSTSSDDASHCARPRLVQPVGVIWLNGRSEQNQAEQNRNIVKLRRYMNEIEVFDDTETCIQFIEKNADEKISLIISNMSGGELVSRVHHMPQLASIFLLNDNGQPLTRWSKIKGTFVEIASLCAAVNDAARQCGRDTTSVSFMASSVERRDKKSSTLDCSFMYTQILKELLLTVPFDPEHFELFTRYCRNLFAGNDYEMSNIEMFQHDYHSRTPVWWYTYECFLYPMLNRALRTMDAVLIVNLGFYIGDLHRQIEQLYTEQMNARQCDKEFTLYRGQGLTTADFEQLRLARNGLMAFNSFLSTSTDRDVSLLFAQQSLSNPDMVGILFVMTVDPTQSTTPFASIKQLSYFKDTEDEVLFSMHSIFRIQDVQQLDADARLFQVNLTLTTDNDRELHTLTERIRDEVRGSTEWFAVGELLCRMGQFDKAEEVYQVLLDHTVDEHTRACIYERLATAKSDEAKYQESIELHQKTLDIKHQKLPHNHPHFATSYFNIASVYLQIGQYNSAHEYYAKTLAIQQLSLPDNHPDLAMTHSSIGVVYDRIGQYSHALTHHRMALASRRRLLPPNHPHLADSYNNIGIVYRNMTNLTKALSCYKKSLAIRQRSLPPNHPDLGASYNNIGETYQRMNQPSTAIEHYGKALDVQQHSLPSNHPHLATCYNNIGLAYEQMNDVANARVHYAHAVDIARQSLPETHPDRQQWEANLDGVRGKV